MLTMPKGKTPGPNLGQRRFNNWTNRQFFEPATKLKNDQLFLEIVEIV